MKLGGSYSPPSSFATYTFFAKHVHHLHRQISTHCPCWPLSHNQHHPSQHKSISRFIYQPINQQECLALVAAVVVADVAVQAAA